MSRRFGAVRQIAYIVRDIDAAVEYWTGTLGVGPFWVLRNVTPAEFWYRGEPSAPPTLSIALGNSGDLQVELIEQHCDSPSAYRDFLASAGEGMQHVSSWVTAAEYDALRERLLAEGVTIAHEGSIGPGAPRFAYFATDTFGGGPLFEISDPIGTPIEGIFDRLAEAAKNWDGSNPILDGV